MEGARVFRFDSLFSNRLLVTVGYLFEFIAGRTSNAGYCNLFTHKQKKNTTMLCCLPEEIFNHICSFIIESSRSDYPEYLHSSSTTSLLLPLKFTCKSLLFDNNSILSSNFNPLLFQSLFKFSLFFGNLDLLTWSYSYIDLYQKHVWNEDACSEAALYGHLDVLKYLRQNGCPWNSDACSSAALNGHLDVLKYLRQNGCSWNSNACSSAALNGHLDVLKYFYQKRSPWDERACSNAALNGHLDVLKYLHENRCRWNSNACSIL